MLGQEGAAEFLDTYHRLLGVVIDGYRREGKRYMTVAKLSFARRTAIEYMVLAVKGRPRQNYGAWPIPAGAK